MQQTTIFGAKPPAPKPDAPRPSKKRKSVSTAEEQSTAASPAADEATTSGSTNSKLEAFRLKAKPAPTSQSTAKAGSAASAGLGGAEGARELPREGEEMEETQVVDETQEESLGAERRASELEVVREETEPPVERADETQGEDADTQMTDTQVVVDEDPVRAYCYRTSLAAVLIAFFPRRCRRRRTGALPRWAPSRPSQRLARSSALSSPLRPSLSRQMRPRSLPRDSRRTVPSLVLFSAFACSLT